MSDPPNKKVGVDFFEKLRTRIASMRDRPATKIYKEIKDEYPGFSRALLLRSIGVAIKATPAMMELFAARKITTEAMRELCQGMPDEATMEYVAKEAAEHGWGYPAVVRIKQEIIRANGKLSLADAIQKALSPIPVPQEFRPKPPPGARPPKDPVEEVGRLGRELREAILHAQKVLSDQPKDPAKGHREIFEKCCLIRHFVVEQTAIMKRDAQRYAGLGGTKVLLKYLEEQLGFLEKTIHGYVETIMKHVASQEELLLLRKEIGHDDGESGNPGGA